MMFSLATVLASAVLTLDPQTAGQPGRVSGQVIDSTSNAPVSGARVSLDAEQPDSRFTAEVMSDENGRYQFLAVPPGPYAVIALKNGYAVPMDRSAAVTFTLVSGQNIDGLTVPMQRGGILTGRVLAQNGEPMPEASVMALLKRLETPGSAPPIPGSVPTMMPLGQNQTNDLGEFRVYGLPAGEYVLAVRPQRSVGDGRTPPRGTIPSTTFYPGVADASAARAVTVHSGETLSDLTIRIAMTRGFQVSGVIVDDRGTPLTNVPVMLSGSMNGRNAIDFLSMGMDGMSMSDRAGRFTFDDVPAGAYTLHGGVGGIGAFGGSFGQIGIGPDGIPVAVDVPGGGTPPREPGTIDVIVKDADISGVKLVVPPQR